MIKLVSPDYNLETFCKHMQGRDIKDVMDAAGAEIYNACRLHRETTQKDNFREGSTGSKYCENLKHLVSLLLNGSVPAGCTTEFLITVKPLVQQLLQKWEIGNLRKVFSHLQTPASIGLPKGIKPLIVVVSRVEVEAMDTSAALGVLRKLTDSPDTAREFLEGVDIAFHGYDHDQQELFEIGEVRNFVYKLDEEFPFWLFFLSKQYSGLQCLLRCFLPPFLTEEARSEVFPERINQLLTKRWFPAMNQMCSYVGFSDNQIEQLTERAMAYIETGRFV
ncbi:MAG: hypothetical protein ACLPN1_01355 [Dissulfurispiraceae bacterium]